MKSGVLQQNFSIMKYLIWHGKNQHGMKMGISGQVETLLRV